MIELGHTRLQLSYAFFSLKNLKEMTCVRLLCAYTQSVNNVVQVSNSQLFSVGILVSITLVAELRDIYGRLKVSNVLR